ncbi:MAG: hypothetical protein PWQ70_2903 [Clostridiales bacterium]|nr:hypothetical protein [Clostridiales bacterium]
MVKKRMNRIFNMVIPTLLAYGVFYLLYNTFQQHFYEYRWIAAIPLAIVTGYIIIENKKEWKTIKQQG